jgi:hypothetical protein
MVDRSVEGGARDRILNGRVCVPNIRHQSLRLARQLCANTRSSRLIG